MHRKGTTKLHTLNDIAVKKQSEWELDKVFESSPDCTKEKFFVTFPFPYMNGMLHLGHAFSLSKGEFSMGYERLKGKNTMWGFGLHCTGMPIKSSADKLRQEMKLFGFPPVFPTQTLEVKVEEKKEIGADKSKGKKSKAVAKSGGVKYQWQIMRNNGMSDDEIKQFTDPMHWLQYFPPLTIQHMRQLGISVDWRRSFITTDANPYFDSFVRWQFNKLKQSSKIMFGKRETVFSPLDDQPCMDHDRSSGEGVGPQEYTLIKMVLEKPYPEPLNAIDDNVSLVAATLRPETMYGQTNCWIHPDLSYVAVRSSKHGILICVERSARNMAYQEILSDMQGQMEIVCKFKGVELIGCAVVAPLSSYGRIYVLPMMTIKENKGTGIVTSVPSDSPDDFAALRDLKKKAALREKYGVTDEMVLPFEPLPIISTEKYGCMCAPVTVDELKIQSQNDSDKLELAKENCYKYGFYFGKMTVGHYAGEEVQTVKEKIQADLIGSGDAIRYFEPEKQVMSRSGDECVVAKCDQWYLNYGNEEWKDLTRKCLAQVDTCSKEVRNCFEAVLDRMHEYACSRSYGLGTRIPWDEQYLVESLSDSTIYMAYYTVAHHLHADSLDGRSDGASTLGIRSDDMDNDAWEYVLGDQTAVADTLRADLRHKLDTLRHEFLYWYPVDLRVSGKDLVPNHLTYYMYNHVAVWPHDPAQYWPKKIRANGHLLLNHEKMSKSTGNYLTVVDAIEKYSADGMRLALADSGDTADDANFDENMADAGVLRLFTFLEWVKEMLAEVDDMRTGPLTLHADLVFAHAINRTIGEADTHYTAMMYRRVVQVAFHELQSLRDRYREVSLNSVHRDLIMRFIEVQCLLLSPICPHLCDHIWRDVLDKPYSILTARWPVAEPIDHSIVTEGNYIDEIAVEFRKQSLQKPKGRTEPHNSAVIWVAKEYPEWQKAVMQLMAEVSVDGVLPDNRELNKAMATRPILAKKMKKAMDFIQLVREKTNNNADLVAELMNPDVDEMRVIALNFDYLEKTLNLEMGRLSMAYVDESDNEKLLEICCPIDPKIVFEYQPAAAESVTGTLTIVSPQLYVGVFSVNVPVNDNDSVNTVIRRVAQLSAVEDFRRISLYRIVGDDQRTVPHYHTMMDDLHKIPLSAKFVVNEQGISVADHEATVPITCKLKFFLE